ncbi:MAG: hypothetical protein KGQ41_07245, partial [Alphaproteobacteria bacterium]|nr:hypothetical protein [Alphaproteobacteria bacterium]
KGIGILLGPHSAVISSVGFLGGLTLSQLALNAYGAIRERNFFRRDGFLHNGGRTVRNVISGTFGMLAGTAAGAKLASMFSKVAADVQNTDAILNHFTTIKRTGGLFGKPELVQNYSLEAGARAAVETMQQGWSIFWQGIGTGLTNPDFAAAATVFAIAASTAYLSMKSARAISRPVLRVFGYRPA